MKPLDHNTVFDWQPAPFGRIRRVPVMEARRWKHERTAIATPRRRDWTHEEQDRMVAMLDKGRGYDAIAAALGRTEEAVRIRAKRTRCVMLRRPTVLTSRDVADLLGKQCSKAVSDWIGRGWLRGSLVGPRGIWRVQWDHLMAFLHSRAYWMAWDAERITDPDLRAEMTALRHGCGRWLSMGDVARMYAVAPSTVTQWIRKGWVPATRYGNHWVWSEDIAGWLPPCERPRAGIPRGHGRQVVGMDMLVGVAH